MLAQRRMDHAAVEEDLGGVRDDVELLQRLVEFIIVIVREGRHPRLDFLWERRGSVRDFLPQSFSACKNTLHRDAHLLQRHCCAEALLFGYSVLAAL